MAENTTKIPCRLESVAIDGQLGGANQIYDDTLQLFQNVINGLFYDHKDDSSIHVSQEDRDKWDNGGENGKVAAILSFANFAGTPEQTTSPEWEYVLLDASSHILLGINREHEVKTFVDLDDILEYVTSPDYGLIDLNDAQVKRSDMGVASGVATLDEDGKVPASQLPVDDNIGLIFAVSSIVEGSGDVSVITNPEYKWVILDASSHILMGSKTDGSLYFVGVDVLTSYSGQKSGTFANRPSNPYTGQQYFCTDRRATGGSNNRIPIWYNGTGWVDAIGGTVS